MTTKSFRGADAKINECMWNFIRYAAKVKPEIVVFESVQQAYRRDDGHGLMRSLRAELEQRTGYRYNLYHLLHNAYSIGGPALRRRYFWLASRIPFGVELPILRYKPILNDIIYDLEPLNLCWGPQTYKAPSSRYARQFISHTYVVDGMMTIPKTPLMQRMYDLMEKIEWGPGEHIAQIARRYYERYGKLPKSFAATQDKLIKNDFNMGFTTPMRWNGNKPARVVTGAGLHCVLHPNLNRLITHREAARILGYPDDWHIASLRNVKKLEATWGKGITTHAGRWIGSWIKRALDGEPGSITGNEVGEREKVLDNTNFWKTL